MIEGLVRSVRTEASASYVDTQVHTRRSALTFPTYETAMTSPSFASLSPPPASTSTTSTRSSSGSGIGSSPTTRNDCPLCSNISFLTPSFNAFLRALALSAANSDFRYLEMAWREEPLWDLRARMARTTLPRTVVFEVFFDEGFFEAAEGGGMATEGWGWGRVGRSVRVLRSSGR